MFQIDYQGRAEVSGDMRGGGKGRNKGEVGKGEDRSEERGG